MFKNKFSLKNVATVVACFAVCAVMSCGGCKKSGGDDDDNGGGGSGNLKFSPPSWIQGSWGEFVGGGAVYKFTADDFIQYGVSYKASLFSPGVTFSCKETKTDVLYEFKITAKAKGMPETGHGTYSFKKGDGTYIEHAQAFDDDKIDPSDYERLDKAN
jgi:hypothetical protein